MTTHSEAIEAGIEKWRTKNGDSEGVVIDWVTIYAVARMSDERPVYKLGYVQTENGIPWASTGMVQAALSYMESDMWQEDDD